MILVDSFGWIEYFANGRLAERYVKYIETTEEIIVPTVVIYEVYKQLKSKRGEKIAQDAYAHMAKASMVPLTDDIAVKAADISLASGLAMADAIIYVTAMSNNAKLVTSDSHLKNLAGVTFIE